MKISLITPLHNKGQYIAETIESVLRQTHLDWEMIIVENHSTDDGPQIAQRYAQKDARIHFVNAPREVQGPGAARNFGLKHATGEWVLFLDADDLIKLDYLKTYEDVITECPNVDVIVGNWMEFEHSFIFDSSKVMTPAFNETNKINLRDTAICFTPWAIHAALVKKSMMDDENLWNESLDGYVSEDTSFWFKIIMTANIKRINYIGALYRVGIDLSRNSPDSKDSWIIGFTNVLHSNLEYLKNKRINLSTNQIESIYRYYENAYIRYYKSLSVKGRQTAYQNCCMWMREYMRQNYNKNMSMTIRSGIGIRFWLQLKKTGII